MFKSVCACCLKFTVMVDCLLLLCGCACLGVRWLLRVLCALCVIVLSGVLWFGWCVIVCVCV